MEQLKFINRKLIGKEKVDFEAKTAKGGLPKSIWPSYSAFANTDGGTIALGIKESDGTFLLEGVEDPDKLIKDFWDIVNNPQKVSSNIISDSDVEIQEIDGSTIVLIHVPRANRHARPVYIDNNLNNGTYRRNGEGDYRCSMSEIRLMMSDNAERSPDRTLFHDLGPDALNRKCIRAYRNIVDSKRPDHDWSLTSDEEYLELIGAIEKDENGYHPTLAGLLCFGSDVAISRQLPNYFVEYVEYGAGGDDWTHRIFSGSGEWTGNLFEFYIHVNNRIRLMSERRFEIGRDLKRIDDDRILKAMREMVINAIVHADYAGSGGIKVEWRYDSFTVRNPGLFRIPIDVAERGGISDPRNPTLITMFIHLGDAERAGTGVRRIMHTCSDMNLGDPSIRESNTPTSVTVRMGTIPVKEKGDLRDDLLDIIRTDGRASIAIMAEMCGASEYAVYSEIKRMRSEGLIHREGGTRGTWIIQRK